MQAVILAGGKGSRLHPITSTVPKPMLSLFGQPIMEHCVRLLADHGIEDIIVTLSSKAQQIMDYFGDGSSWKVKLRYSVEEDPKGTAGAVKQVQHLIDGPFLVIAADTVTDFNLEEAWEFHREKSAIATLLVHKVDDPMEYGLVGLGSDGRVTRLVEKPKSEEVFTDIINTGICICEPEVLSSIPYETFYDFSRDLLPRLLRNQEPVYACRLDGYWCDIGSLMQYRNAHFDALLGKAKIEIAGKEVEKGVWLGNDVEIHKTARIRPPLFLGEGTDIRRNASLGGFSVIGEASLVDEGATVARSILGSGTFVGRATRITDCVIGNGYHVLDQLNVQNRVIVDGAAKEIYPIWDLPDVAAPEPERLWAVDSSSLAA